MILYKEDFPLGKDVPFSRYIETLDEKNFSPYTLLIKELPGTENYHIEIILTDLLGLWRIGSYFINGALFDDGIIQYSKGAGEFTLQASIGRGNLFSALLSLIPALFLLLFVFFMIFTKRMSLDNILVFLIIMIVILAPLISTYIRDRNLLKKIGSLALELNQEKGK
jgi:hypothetical protein